MRCETHCPPPEGGFPIGRALAVLAVAAATSLVTAFLAAVSGVVYAVLVAVWVVLVPAASVFAWRKVRGVGRVRQAYPRTLGQHMRAAVTSAQRRALPAARPVVQGVVVREGERIGR